MTKAYRDLAISTGTIEINGSNQRVDYDLPTIRTGEPDNWKARAAWNVIAFAQQIAGVFGQVSR